MVEDLLIKKATSQAADDVVPVSLKTGLTALPDANLAVISVPERYAYMEAKKALLAGLNVFLFSDNLTIEEERI